MTIDMNTEQRNSNLAVTSLVLGILSLICLGILTGIPAIITGHFAHNRARRMPAQYGGAGMAIAGFIMGYLSILVTIVVAILLALALPAFHQARTRAMGGMGGMQNTGESIRCVNNLKNVGLAFRIWATDHEDKYPFNADAAQGGTRELCERDPDGFDLNAARHLQVLANELSTPTILICPSDRIKRPTGSFLTLQPENVSYQFRSGPDVKETNPTEVLALCPIHGHELLCDGSVMQGQRR